MTSSERSSALRRYPYVGAAIAISLGLLDWLIVFVDLDRGLLATLLREMSQITASLTILAGLAALTTMRAGLARSVVIGGRICALLVASVGVLSVVADIGGIRIDRMLQYAITSWPSGSPSVQTGAAFATLGIALMLVDNERPGHRRVADWLALVAIAFATFAMLGYLFGVPAFYSPPTDVAGQTLMSVPTVIAVLLLATSVLLTRVETGILAVVVADDAGGIVARRLLGGLLVFPVICIVLVAGTVWYSHPVSVSLVLAVVIGPGSVLILSTARRLSRADRALRTSEAQLRQVVDKASDAIFIAAPDGQFTHVNEAANRLLGYGGDELEGKAIADLIPVEDTLQLARSREQMARGMVDVAEWRLRRRDGGHIWVEMSSKLLPDGRWQTIARDISQRKAAVAELARTAASERTMRVELESVMRAVTASLDKAPMQPLDSALRVIAEKARVAVGAAYAAIAIGSNSDRAFEHWASVGMREDMEKIIGRIPRPVGVLGEAVRRREVVRYADVTKVASYRGLPAGHPPITSFLACPIEHDGRIVGTLYLANKHDAHEFSLEDADIVTAFASRVAPAIEMATRYETEQTMRRWLLSIIEQLPEGVIVIDEHGSVKAINRAMLALKRAEPIEMDPFGNPRAFDVRTPDKKPLPFDELPLVVAFRDGTFTRERELLICKADGTMVPIVASAAPLRDALQRITGAVLVVTEITERKELERLREEWIAVVAHDLRQPLNTILLWSDRLTTLTNEATSKRAIERIQGAAWRLNRMVQDLLDAARIAATRLAIDPHASDLVAAVALAIENARDASPDATFVLDAPARGLAWFDNDRIQQVLANLLSNAAKYGQRGEPIRVTIRDDDTLEVAVTSKGPEIPADQRARLFSRFSRTDAARASGVPGIGLGLYITKGLVEAHGGKIWIESTGTENTFRFTVPRPPEH